MLWHSNSIYSTYLCSTLFITFSLKYVQTFTLYSLGQAIILQTDLLFLIGFKIFWSEWASENIFMHQKWTRLVNLSRQQSLAHCEALKIHEIRIMNRLGVVHKWRHWLLSIIDTPPPCLQAFSTKALVMSSQNSWPLTPTP